MTTGCYPDIHFGGLFAVYNRIAEPKMFIDTSRALFELNAKNFPGSPNVYAGLATIAEVERNLDEARRYKRGVVEDI